MFPPCSPVSSSTHKQLRVLYEAASRSLADICAASAKLDPDHALSPARISEYLNGNADMPSAKVRLLAVVLRRMVRERRERLDKLLANADPRRTKRTSKAPPSTDIDLSARLEGV